MSDPIPGALAEWVEIEPTRWERTGHPEDGIIAVTPPMTFEEYYARRLAQSKMPLPPTIEERLAALEERMK